MLPKPDSLGSDAVSCVLEASLAGGGRVKGSPGGFQTSESNQVYVQQRARSETLDQTEWKVRTRHLRSTSELVV